MLRTRTDAYRDDVAPDDYVPSVEPASEKPDTHMEGYHSVVAADVKRGDLFLHPYRVTKFFPVNTRIVGDNQGYPFIRLEYIDVYGYDAPVNWEPTAARVANPSWIMVQGYDFTPSEGVASVTLYPDEWIFIKNRPTSMGTITRSAGQSAGGEADRYRWFWNNDTYTYNLLDAMFTIGKGAIDFNEDRGDLVRWRREVPRLGQRVPPPK